METATTPDRNYQRPTLRENHSGIETKRNLQFILQTIRLRENHSGMETSIRKEVSNVS